jgi:signal transduction histidine kinase
MGNQSEPRIEFEAHEQDGETICRVCDNGIGIQAAYHEKVFGLFEQLDQNQAGTGVGLALVRRIIEVHGGQVWVESEGLGKGACFSFTLPSSG